MILCRPLSPPAALFKQKSPSEGQPLPLPGVPRNVPLGQLRAGEGGGKAGPWDPAGFVRLPGRVPSFISLSQSA